MKYSILTFLFLKIFLCSSQSSLSKYGIDQNTYIPKGLNIGDTAPTIHTKSILGKELNSLSILETTKIVVLFYRGQWCPVCERHLNNLSDSISMITIKNAIVIAIGPEAQHNALKLQEKTETSIDIIADTSYSLLKQFDVLFNVSDKYEKKIKTYLRTDIASNNVDSEAFLPVPATYIIGHDNKIEYKHFDYDYKSRATVKDILDNL